MSISPSRSWADQIENSEEDVNDAVFIPAAATPPSLRRNNEEKKEKESHSQSPSKQITDIIGSPITIGTDIPTDLRDRLVFIVGTQGFDNITLLKHLNNYNCNPILVWCLPDRDPLLGLRPLAHAVFKTKEEAEELITRRKTIINPNPENKSELDFRVFEPFDTKPEQNPNEAKVSGYITDNELRSILKDLDLPTKIRRIKFGNQVVHILKFSSSLGTSIAIRRLNHYKTVRGILRADFGKSMSV